MTVISTATEARTIVQMAVATAGRARILGEVGSWNNTTENDIDADGNVWVANPQTGHWLDDPRMIEFATFLHDAH